MTKVRDVDATSAFAPEVLISFVLLKDASIRLDAGLGLAPVLAKSQAPGSPKRKGRAGCGAPFLVRVTSLLDDLRLSQQLPNPFDQGVRVVGLLQRVSILYLHEFLGKFDSPPRLP